MITPKQLVDGGICVSFAEARRLIASSASEIRLQEMLKYKHTPQVVVDLVDALNGMLVATDESVVLPPGHPGQKAYLEMVAIPRAKVAIQNALKEG